MNIEKNFINDTNELYDKKYSDFLRRKYKIIKSDRIMYGIIIFFIILFGISVLLSSLIFISGVESIVMSFIGIIFILISIPYINLWIKADKYPDYYYNYEDEF